MSNKTKFVTLGFIALFVFFECQLQCSIDSASQTAPHKLGEIVVPPGIARVVTNSPGLLAGSGTTTNPLTATLSVTAPITGTGSAGAAFGTSFTDTAPFSGTGSAGSPFAVATFGTSNSGVVPSSGGGTNNFIRADGTWAIPSGTGAVTGRNIFTTAPLTGGGDFSIDRTHAIATNGITAALFRQSAGLSVVGNATGSTANVADITAGADSMMLARASGALSFIDIPTAIATLANRGHYGDGSDGAINFDGSSTITLGNGGTTIVPSGSAYTLPRDIFPSTVVIGSGVTVNGAGFWIFASVSANGPGTYQANGGNGGNGTTSGGAGGAAAYLSARCNSSGIAGGAGSTTTAGGAGVSNNSAPNPSPTGGGGATSGASGTKSNAGGAGGNGGTGTGNTGGGNNPLGANAGGYKYFEALVNCRGASGTAVALSGCSGAGGGGATSVGGGGGGGGGGNVGLMAPQVLGAITVQANGGNGGNGAAGNSGGGGGGGGGYAILDCITGCASVTLQALGGNGGAKSGTGVNGGNGFAGVTIKIP